MATDTCTFRVLGVPPKISFPWICASYNDELIELEVVKIGEVSTFPAHVGSQLIKGCFDGLIKFVMCDVDECGPKFSIYEKSWSCGSDCPCPMSSWYWGPKFHNMRLSQCSCFDEVRTTNSEVVCYDHKRDANNQMESIYYKQVNETDWEIDIPLEYWGDLHQSVAVHAILRITLPLAYLASALIHCNADIPGILKLQQIMLEKIAEKMFSDMFIVLPLSDLQKACIKALLPEVPEPQKGDSGWIRMYNPQALLDELEERKDVENMQFPISIQVPEESFDEMCIPIFKTWRPYTRTSKLKKIKDIKQIRKKDSRKRCELLQWQ